MTKVSTSYRLFQIFNIAFMLSVVFITLYPFLYVLITSISDEAYVIAGEISFYPKGIHFGAYDLIMQKGTFWVGYRNTIFYTLLGTLIALFMSTIMAYPVSKTRIKGRNFLIAMVIFTMFFNGGLVPNYLLIKELNMLNTIWAIVIPTAINTWNLIVMITFFRGIPQELEESAAVDGLNPIMTLIRIVLPLSKPIMATMGLFYSVHYWNEWFRAFIFLNDIDKMPVTLFLRNIIAGAQLSADSGMEAEELSQIAVNLQSATVILVVTPILFIYPFIQKYFVKGVMIGSLKG